MTLFVRSLEDTNRLYHAHYDRLVVEDTPLTEKILITIGNIIRMGKTECRLGLETIRIVNGRNVPDEVIRILESAVYSPIEEIEIVLQ